MTVLYASTCHVAYQVLAIALNSELEPDHPELKLPAPKFQLSRPGQNGPATVMASRLTNKRMRSGRVPVARNRIRSRTKLSFCSSRFSSRKAVALGLLWRFRGRVENEIGKGGNLGTILRTVRCLLVSCGSVDVSQTIQTVRLSKLGR